MSDWIGDAGLTGALTGAGGTCSLHRFHAPRAETTEFHHVVPQAWQAFWNPNMTPGQTALNVPALWDPRTVELCPTGHRNVHFHLVRLMKVATSEVVAEIVAGYEHVERRRMARNKEFGIAVQAIERWTAAGGSVRALQDAGQWGMA